MGRSALRARTQVRPGIGRSNCVRFERLVIGAGSNSFTLDLHPRLTVIAGSGRLERESLLGELVGALGQQPLGRAPRAVQDAGRRLAVFRPEHAPPPRRRRRPAPPT